MSENRSELAKAVCQVMARCRSVPETGYNQHGRYKYASDSDLLGVLQPAMAEAGLALIPSGVEASTTQHGESKQGNSKWRTDLVVTYELLHVSGECRKVQVPGCGIDNDDKGPYKAMTGALKYALRHLFLVPTGDDVERDRRDPPATGGARQEQQEERRQPTTSAWDAERWTNALALAGAHITLDEALWWSTQKTTSKRHPKDLDDETRQKALEWFCSEAGASAVRDGVDLVRQELRGSFFAKWNVMYPPPRKRDGASDEDVQRAGEASERYRRAVLRRWYGVDSLKLVPVRAALRSDRSLSWLREVSQPDFEAAVDEVLGGDLGDDAGEAA